MKKGLFVLTMLFFASNSYGQSMKENILLGMQKFGINDYKGAIIDFSKAIEMAELDTVEYSELYAGIYFHRGMSKRELEDFRGAIKDLTKALVLFKDSPLTGEGSNLTTINMIALTFYGRGLVQMDLKAYNEALNDINEAIKLDNKDGSFFMVRGEAKILLGQKDSGCLDFSRAGELGAEGAYERIKGNCN